MSTAENIGERIRRIRQARGVSLRKVAQQLGVSPSLISQVETGKSRPSVATLYSLAGLLEVSADELLGIEGTTGVPSFSAAPPLTPEVQRASENPMIEMEDGVRWERLASRPDGRTDSLLVTYEAGASSSPTGKLTRHSGFEQAFILEGELVLRLEFDEYVLGPGDSLQFESARPHLYLNRSAAPARGVWFVMDRNGAGLEAEPGADGGRWRPHPPANPLNVLRRFDHLD